MKQTESLLEPEQEELEREFGSLVETTLRLEYELELAVRFREEQ